MDTISTILLVAGIAFIIAEMVLPGGIVMWLGVSSILLVAARYFGHLQAIPDLFLAWSALSIGLVTFSVVFLQRFFGGEVESNRFDDLEEALGQSVQVEQLVSSKTDSGRIQYQGTTWNARTQGPDISEGSKAIIVGRENITWIVKKPETEEA